MRFSRRCAIRSPATVTRATSSCRASICRACSRSRRPLSSARAEARCNCSTTVRTLETLKTQFRRIIVAVGPHQLKTLLPEAIVDFTYQPIYTCYLQYPASTRLGFPMLGMADGLVQWVFDRGALLGENGRLACVISAQGDHQQLSQDEVAETCHRELTRAKLVAQEPLWTRVIAEKRATITCTPGLRRPEVQANGVILAGDYTDAEYPPTLEAAVRSGVRAAHLATQE